MQPENRKQEFKHHKRLKIMKASEVIANLQRRFPNETGKYLIHPQFVYRDVYDFKDMRDGMRQHYQMATPQFLS